MDPQQAFTELLRRLNKLLLLNPDLGVAELQELYRFADALDLNEICARPTPYCASCTRRK